jgi:hypothetical protein
MRLVTTTAAQTACESAAHHAGQEADSGILGRSDFVTDIIMLAIGLSFFALSVAYAYACERL